MSSGHLVMVIQCHLSLMKCKSLLSRKLSLINRYQSYPPALEKWNETSQINWTWTTDVDVFSKELLHVALSSCCKILIYPDHLTLESYKQHVDNREQRQSGPSITGSFLMRFMMFSFDFKSTQCLKNPKAMGWNLKYHGSVDAAFCVSQLLSSWPHPCAQQKFGKVEGHSQDGKKL